MHNKNFNVFLRTSCAFSILLQFCKIQSCKPGCAPAGPATHFLWSTARIRQDISAAAFCSCKLLGRIDEFVLLPCFNAQPDIFAVMNCCVVALIVFSSDILAWSADGLYSARACARGWFGVNPPLILLFDKTLLPSPRKLVVFAYFLLVNLST